MKIGLRPFLPADAAVLVAIFRAAIEELAVDDYDEDQRAAWAAAADDPAAFAGRLADGLTLVALADGEIAGFATLADDAVLDLLYVRPEMAGEGVATALVDALERLAAARGAKSLTVEASDTALPAFQRWGYRAERRNTVMRAGTFLANTTMTKALAPPTRERPPA